MATKHEAKPTVAPIVGPDDERVFTDSGHRDQAAVRRERRLM